MHLSTNDLFLLTQCAISAACQAGHKVGRVHVLMVRLEVEAKKP